MKKYLLVLLMAMAITCVSCEGPRGPAGVDGEQGTTGIAGKDGEGTRWFTKSFEIKESDWQLAGTPGSLNSFFYIDIPVSQLTNTIYNSGTMIAYINNNEGIKTGLPFVLHKGDEDDLGEFFWTQTYDCEFYPGGITFNATFSDFATSNNKPGKSIFHIVLMW